ncbi:hypothetical protein GYH30_004476 [Glycine max]|nr:hypothetical protein GYH30_004476 [Glycine max]
MHKSPTGNLVPLDLEIEVTLRRNRVERRRKLLQDRTVASILEEEAQSSDFASSYSPSSRESTTDLSEASVMAEEHQHRVTLEDYSRNLFHGLPNEDPYTHLATYIEICNTIKIAGVLDDAIGLSLFSFSLAREAKKWLHSFKGNSMKTWEKVFEKFLKKYFPESKTTKGKAAISSFHQFPDGSFSEALERFLGLLRKNPTHGFSEPIQLNMFIDGLRPQTKQLLDASAGGKIKLKTPEEATELIENMSASDHAILHDIVHQPTKKSLLELSSQDALLAHNKLLSKQLEILTETLGKLPTKVSTSQSSHSSVLQVTGCTIYGEAHESGPCIPIEEHTQEVHYMGNQQTQGYNQGGFLGFQQGPYNQQGQ